MSAPAALCLLQLLVRQRCLLHGYEHSARADTELTAGVDHCRVDSVRAQFQRNLRSIANLWASSHRHRLSMLCESLERQCTEDVAAPGRPNDLSAASDWLEVEKRLATAWKREGDHAICQVVYTPDNLALLATADDCRRGLNVQAHSQGLRPDGLVTSHNRRNKCRQNSAATSNTERH